MTLARELARLGPTAPAIQVFVCTDCREVEGRKVAAGRHLLTARPTGGPTRITRRARLRVDGFIGSPAMNMLPARLAADAGSVELDGVCLAVNAPPEQAGREVTLGLRPEHITLGQGQAGEFPFTVDFVEALGADTLAHGFLGKSRIQLTVRLPGSARVTAGDALSLVAPAESLHLFDATTGGRL